MDTAMLSEWLDQHIWPQIHSMMLNDAYYKLFAYARELTGQFNGPIGSLVVTGYVTSQTLAIRRLCDNRNDVISIKRLLQIAKKKYDSNDQIEELLRTLDICTHICNLVNDYVAHTANPRRKQNVSDWNLQVGHLVDAQRAICEVAIIFDRDLLHRKNYIALIPVPQYNITEEFKNWVPQEMIEKLWEFWHNHNRAVNAWIPR